MEEELIEPIIWPNQAPHPLKIPLILTNLFKLCPPKHLPKIRLVCRQWRDLSLPMCRSSLPIILSKFGSDIVLGPITDRMYHEPYNFKYFVRDYVNNPQIKSDQFQYRAIKLLRWCLDSNHYFLRPVWDPVRNIVTTLEVDDCSIPEVEEFRKLIYQTFPNLKVLRILNCQFGDNVRPSQNLQYIEPAYGEHRHLKALTFKAPNCKGRNKLPLTWLDLFSHFPSLAHFYIGVGKSIFSFLSLDNLDEEKVEQWKQLFQAIAIVREHHDKKLPITSFTVRSALDIVPTREQAVQLQKINLPMEPLVMVLHLAPDMEDKLVNEILQVFAKHLRKLLVTPKNRSLGLQNCRFPHGGMELKNLRSLQMWDVLCENVNFLKFTPNLEELRFSHSRISYEVMFGCDTKYYNSTQMICNSWLPDDYILTNLTCFACEHLLSVDDVSKLAKWMPNIQNLQMFLSDDQFRIVCENWSDLTHLTVWGIKLTNEGLTGCLSQHGWLPKPNWPNITYLQNLEMFYALNFVIEDVSIFHGFLHLPHIRQLEINEHSTISDNARGQLRMKTGIWLTCGSMVYGNAIPLSESSGINFLERN